MKDISAGDLSRIISRAQGKQSFEDWPWIIICKQLDEAFPGSQFVLTIRDKEDWLKSYKNMLSHQSNASQHMNEIRRTRYGLPFPNASDDELIERYQRHENDVKYHFRNRPEDLLIVDWQKVDGWEKLCSFW